MARVVGDGLKVNVARKPGEEQIIDLMALFNQNPNKIIVVAGTVGEGGAPNTCPVSLIYAKDEKTLLVGLLRNSGTTANLRRDGRVSLEIIGPDDLVMGIQGTMRLVREPMAMQRRHGHLGDAGHQGQTRHLPGPAGGPGAGLGAPVGQGRRPSSRPPSPNSRVGFRLLGEGAKGNPYPSPKPPSPIPYK